VAKKRRSQDEVTKLVSQIDALVAGGKSVDEATKELNLSPSVYWKRKREGTPKPRGQTRDVRVSGSVRADSLPPRPKKKKGGYRIPKPVNLNDIESVAKRIAKLDRRLREIDGLVRERIRLVGHLLTLLKDKQKAK
jgi:hypothetical protein